MASLVGEGILEVRHGVIFCYTFESERCPRVRPIPILEGMRNFPETLAENAYDVTGGFEVRQMGSNSIIVFKVENMTVPTSRKQHSCAISADQSEVVCVGRFGQANVPGALFLGVLFCWHQLGRKWLTCVLGFGIL